MATLAILSIIAIAIFALLFVVLRLPDQSQTQTIAPTVAVSTTLQPKNQPDRFYAPNMAGTVVLQKETIKEFYPFTNNDNQPTPDATEQIQIDKAIEDFKKNLPTRSK